MAFACWARQVHGVCLESAFRILHHHCEGSVIVVADAVSFHLFDSWGVVGRFSDKLKRDARMHGSVANMEKRYDQIGNNALPHSQSRLMQRLSLPHVG